MMTLRLWLRVLDGLLDLRLRILVLLLLDMLRLGLL